LSAEVIAITSPVREPVLTGEQRVFLAAR